MLEWKPCPGNPKGNSIWKVIYSSSAFTLSPPVLSTQALDQLVRDVEESLRGQLVFWLLVATILVAVGVLMEGPEIVHEVRNAIAQCRRERSKERAAPPWMTLVGAIGWLLIVVGVAGEFLMDAGVNSIDEEIQSVNAKMLVDTQNAAGDAKYAAGSATRSAEEAAEDATRANRESADAQSKAVGATREADSFAGEIRSAKEQV